MQKFVARYKWYIVTISVVVIGIAVYMNSCGGAMVVPEGIDTAAESNGQTADGLKIVLSPLDEGSTEAVSGLAVDTSLVGDNIHVIVTVNEGASLPAELFLQLDYGDSALTPADIALKTNDNLVGAAAPSGPTTVDIGLVAIKGQSIPVLQPGETLVSFNLGPESTSKEVSDVEKTVTAVVRNLDLRKVGEDMVLAWDYTNPGDTNQDGEVAITDLKEIAQHFRETIDNSMEDPRRNIDADANGEINAADVGAIAKNLKVAVYGYNIEMSLEDDAPFGNVGQLVLEEQRLKLGPGEAIRFEYNFIGQYVPGAWYRVVPVLIKKGGGVLVGTASEAISDSGRQLDGINVEVGKSKRITVYASGLPDPLTYMNGCRVVFPAGYEYVVGSFNVGSEGGARDEADGIWASFTEGFLPAPESFFVTNQLEDGRQAIDFNVTPVNPFAPHATVNFGDLFNFEFKNVNGGALKLGFQQESGIKRTYYSNETGEEHLFGNAIGFKVN